MRRLLLPLLVSALLVVTACASGPATDTASTSAAAETVTTEPMFDESTMESMTVESTVGEMTAGSTSGVMTESMTSPAEAVTGTTITTASSEFGEILFDGNQQAIYLFDKEASSTPECYDDCAVAWPPVLTTGAPVASGGIDAALLGTTVRTDGPAQVTYGGHPLYFYVDEGPGEVKCHNVAGFGGLWLVVTPTGSAAAV